ncbi:MAG TPA: DUF835 domain-containing protein [Thermoplasmata archaeon]|nr:DUF835 domain-containing protein [Thermoplasmata archaeon]
MEVVPARFDPHAVEASVRAYWAARKLPRDDAAGRASGPPLHQFIGTISSIDSDQTAVHRAVIADIETRRRMALGRAIVGRLRSRASGGEVVRPAVLAALERCAVWVGGGDVENASTIDPNELQRFVDRLAATDLLVVREQPSRSCVRCHSARTPEGIVYQEESGPAYLVKFLLAGSNPPTSALVWIDAAWKLLGTSALLLNPELPYVVVRYRRRDVDEQLLVAKAAVDRLRAWFPGAEMAIVEERPGAEWSGTAYHHPLAAEYPPVGFLPRPAGTLVASSEVGESGTGLVALVPAHGASDAVIARGLQIHGLPVLGADGLVERSTIHKYAGLALDGTESFILRDLADGGQLFAQLRVRRGVPRCGICGGAMVFLPRRAWSLEPGRLPPEMLELFHRLLPDEPVPHPPEPVPWPVSETSESAAANAPQLLECSDCDRLAPHDATGRCTCGGSRRAVRRTLLPTFQEAMSAWAQHRRLGRGEAVQLILPSRRRAPGVVHFLTGLHATGASPGEVRITLVPTLTELSASADGLSTDALRAALAHFAGSPGAGGSLEDAVRRERRRLAKFWTIAGAVTTVMKRDGFVPDFEPISGHRDELSEEDRGFLSGFERMRVEVLRRYESCDSAGVHRLLSDFAEIELRTGYLPLVRPRLEVDGLPPSKVAALRTLLHVLFTWSELFAPIGPFFAEAVHRSLRGEAQSVFEHPPTPVQERCLDADAERDYSRWISVAEAVRHGRHEIGVAAGRRLPTVVLFVRDEAMALQLRQSEATVRRLVGADKVEVASPNFPWEGRSVEARPILVEIQKSHPTLAPRIVRLLRELPGRRVRDGLRSDSLSFVLGGQPVQIVPSMVEVIETLPEGFVPVPWYEGEIFLQLPPERGGGETRRAPSLSLDGFHLVRAVRRQLESAQPPATEVAVGIPEGLRDEIERQGPVIARFLGIERIVVDGGTRTDVPPSASGRTRRGERWKVWVPGVTLTDRPAKLRPRKPPRRRVPNPTDDGRADDDEPLLAEEEVERQRTVREIVDRLDADLGRPLVGPGKVRIAWEAGLRSYDAYTQVSVDSLARVPGFGRALATEIAERVGVGVPRTFELPSIPEGRAAVAVPVVAPLMESPASPLPTSFADAEAVGRTESPKVPAMPPVPTSVPPPVAPPVEPAVRRPPPAESFAPTGPFGIPAGPRPSRPTFVTVPEYLPAAPPAPAPPAPARFQPPKVVAAPTPPPPAPSGIEIVEGDSSDPVWRRFLDLTAEGAPGVCVSREFPFRLRTLLGSRNVELLWLSNAGRDNAIRPGDLAALLGRLHESIEGGASVVYLDGIEYLLRVHGGEKLLTALHDLDRSTRERDALLIIPVNPALLEASVVVALRESFGATGTASAPDPA